MSGNYNNGLDLKTGSSGNNKNFRLYINNDGKYVHDQAFTSSPFFREVRFTEASDTQATFNVKVQWMDGKKVRTIRRNEAIGNSN